MDAVAVPIDGERFRSRWRQPGVEPERPHKLVLLSGHDTTLLALDVEARQDERPPFSANPALDLFRVSGDSGLRVRAQWMMRPARLMDAE
jgi:hypothetical protein